MGDVGRAGENLIDLATEFLARPGGDRTGNLAEDFHETPDSRGLAGFAPQSLVLLASVLGGLHRLVQVVLVIDEIPTEEGLGLLSVNLRQGSQVLAVVGHHDAHRGQEAGRQFDTVDFLPPEDAVALFGEPQPLGLGALATFLFACELHTCTFPDGATVVRPVRCCACWASTLGRD